MEELIREFFECACKGSYERFHFAKFFNRFSELLDKKLATHGILSLKQYIRHMDTYYDLGKAREFVYSGQHSGIFVGVEDVLADIFRGRYEALRMKYLNDLRYKKLFKLHLKLSEWKAWKHLKYQEMGFLVEECIEAERNTGTIVYSNVEDIRNECERKNRVLVNR